MPSSTKLLPKGTKLLPGTLIQIFHSDAKKHKIHETIPVCEDGISVKSSLYPKELEGFVRTFWKVCITTPDGTKCQYYDQVRTEDVVAGRLICLCNKKEAQAACQASEQIYARPYYSPGYYKKYYKKRAMLSELQQELLNGNSSSDISQCLEDFLKSELQHIPCWYNSNTNHPSPSDFQELIDFITPPQEEKRASTSAAARSFSMLERTIVKTTETND